MAHKIDRRTALALTGAAMLLPGMASVPKMATLRGTVFYRERMALPPSAVIDVELVGISLADAPAQTIAQTRIREARTPAPFELDYDPSRIVKGRSYALQARIVVDGELLFINTERYAVFTGGTDKTDILVRHVEPGPAVVAQSLVGRWLAEDIQGAGVIDTAQSMLEIAADGTVGGKGGCNSFGGSAAIEGDTIVFSEMRSKMMACAPALMDQERRFHAALAAARRFRVNETTRKLTLLGEDGAPVMVLAAM